MVFAVTEGVHAEIFTAKTMKEIKAKIDEIQKDYGSEDILVAFDIDMTLTQPAHPAVYYPAIRKYVEVYKEILGRLSSEQKDLVSTLVTQTVPQKIVDKEAPQIVRGIQHQGIRTIALTSSLSGRFKGLSAEKIIFVRRDQLQKIGFDFTKSFKGFVRVKEFLDFEKFAGAYPIFYHGILSTNGEEGTSKGDVLVAFLRHVGIHFEGKANKPGFHPKVIVMIDDKKKHLENVAKVVEGYDSSIQVIGIEYGGAYSYAPQDISREDFQQFWEKVADQAKKLSDR